VSQVPDTLEDFGPLFSFGFAPPDGFFDLRKQGLDPRIRLNRRMPKPGGIEIPKMTANLGKALMAASPG